MWSLDNEPLDFRKAARRISCIRKTNALNFNKVLSLYSSQPNPSVITLNFQPRNWLKVQSNPLKVPPTC